MLLDLIRAVLALRPKGQLGVVLEYYLPYYAGLIIAGTKPIVKKHLLTFFSSIAIIGIIVLATTIKYNVGVLTGIAFIHFSGGFFEGVTPKYRILYLKICRIVFELSPKEVFAVAGVLVYTMVIYFLI